MRCKYLVMILLLSCKGDSKSNEHAPATIAVDQTRPGPDNWGSGEAKEEAKPAATPVMSQPKAPPPGRGQKYDADDGVFKTANEGGGGGAGKGTSSGRTAANRPEGPTRSWFPETFLFQPLVETDDSGAATVPVRVPDRLTTWRVLALAHSRTGRQAGTTTSFLGTLPTYVDPILPKTLVAGDEIRLPIQMINTTDKAVASTLSIESDNARVGGAGGTRTIPALGSLVDYATLRADKIGNVTVRTSLGDTDAVVKTIRVVPNGRPISVTHSGTLAAPRTLALEGPANSNPATDRVRLLVFPGALALLRAELATSTYRQGVADDAYALLLAGRASSLLASLGDKADPVALRELSILTSQRAIRDGRTLDVMSASLLAEAALAHPQNPVMSRLGERAIAFLAQNQRPDGTFAGETGWTLARVLVATADATRAVASASLTPTERARAKQVAMRASSAFERNLEHVDDGYTAAAIVASGAVSGEPLDKLRAKIKDAIKATDDGAKYLDIPKHAQRADGLQPSRAEATALALLALADDPTAKDLRNDLGTTLLGSYSPDHGWGDGRANLACMQAVLALFKDPVPANVQITLTMDGKPITSGTLDRERLRDVLVLDGDAPGLAGKHEWKLVAEPAVPGLGYSLALQGWVPWEKEPVHAGLEVKMQDTIAGTVGKPTELAVSAIAPSGVPVHIEQALPAGITVDTPSLEALVTEGKLARFEANEGKLDLYANALMPGQVLSLKYKVIPTLAGTLRSAASKIEAGDNTAFVPPSIWRIQ